MRSAALLIALCCFGCDRPAGVTVNGRGYVESLKAENANSDATKAASSGDCRLLRTENPFWNPGFTVEQEERLGARSTGGPTDAIHNHHEMELSERLQAYAELYNRSILSNVRCLAVLNRGRRSTSASYPLRPLKPSLQSTYDDIRPRRPK